MGKGRAAAHQAVKETQGRVNKVVVGAEDKPTGCLYQPLLHKINTNVVGSRNRLAAGGLRASLAATKAKGHV